MDQIRKIYQKCIHIPINQVESIWRDYDQFENNLNKVTVNLFYSLFITLIHILNLNF